MSPTNPIVARPSPVSNELCALARSSRAHRRDRCTDSLLHAFLSLERPVPTAQVVSFLERDRAGERLVMFLSRPSEHHGAPASAADHDANPANLTNPKSKNTNSDESVFLLCDPENDPAAANTNTGGSARRGKGEEDEGEGHGRSGTGAHGENDGRMKVTGEELGIWGHGDREQDQEQDQGQDQGQVQEGKRDGVDDGSRRIDDDDGLSECGDPLDDTVLSLDLSFDIVEDEEDMDAHGTRMRPRPDTLAPIHRERCADPGRNRISHTVLNLLQSPSGPIEEWTLARLDEVARGLWRSFDADSEANLYHARDALVYLAWQHPTPLYAALCLLPRGRMLAPLRHLHHPAAAEVLLALLDHGEDLREDVRLHFAHHHFPAERFAAELAGRLAGRSGPRDAAAAAEFLRCVVAKVRSDPGSLAYALFVADKAVLGVLLRSLCSLVRRGGAHIDAVLSVVIALASADDVADACPERGAAAADHMVGDYVVNHVIHSPGVLAAIDQFLAAPRARPTPAHHTALELLVRCCQQDPALVLLRLTPRTWTNLVSWFFARSGNNILHRLFFQMVVIAVLEDDASSLRAIIAGGALVRRAYECLGPAGCRNAGYRGFLLATCNVIAGRLADAAAADPDAQGASGTGAGGGARAVASSLRGAISADWETWLLLRPILAEAEIRQRPRYDLVAIRAGLKDQCIAHPEQGAANDLVFDDDAEDSSDPDEGFSDGDDIDDADDGE